MLKTGSMFLPRLFSWICGHRKLENERKNEKLSKGWFTKGTEMPKYKRSRKGDEGEITLNES